MRRKVGVGRSGTTRPLRGAISSRQQQLGRVEHDNPADYYNTALKMAKKRAQVDATLTVTAASDFFTQDLEPLPPSPPEATDPQPQPKAEVVDYMTSDQLDWLKELEPKKGLTEEARLVIQKCIATGATKLGAQRLIGAAEKMVQEYEAAMQDQPIQLTDNDMPL